MRWFAVTEQAEFLTLSFLPDFFSFVLSGVSQYFESFLSF